MTMEPQSLIDWAKDEFVPDEMVYKNAAVGQVKAFREAAEAMRADPFVVSTHRSKSIDLPVVEFRTKYGVRCIVRDNFHDVKASVWCPGPCDHDLFGLPAGGDSYLHPVYFEGFEDGWIHEPFVLGARKFSVCLSWDRLIPFAQALRWAFYDEDGKARDFTQKPSSRPKGPYFDTAAAMRRVATYSFFPVIYMRSTVSVLYRFFRAEEPIDPDEARLRAAFTRQAPGYDGKVSDEPIPYLDLDFTSGCSEPVDAWLRILDKLVKERRKDPSVRRLGDDVGARVNVARMTPELRARAEGLGCLELLRKPDHR